MARTLIPDLRTDCGRLITSYLELNTTSFLDFVGLWKAQQFNLIYAGQGETEIDYFIFHAIHAAKGFCDPSKTRQERVAGLYLLYLLYYTEPLKVKKPIRLIPEEFNCLKTLAEEFKSENKEVSYAFYKLLLDNAFDFVVTALPYDETLIHYKEDLKTQGQSALEVEVHKVAVENVFKQTGFDKKEWSKMVKDYNSIKKKINNICSLNLSLTKSLD